MNKFLKAYFDIFFFPFIVFVIGYLYLSFVTGEIYFIRWTQEDRKGLGIVTIAVFVLIGAALGEQKHNKNDG